MFHASADVPHVGGCPTRRRIFHGDAPSHGRHRLRGLKDHSNPGDPSNRNAPNAPNAPSNRSNGNISDPRNLINGSDYSSEASSFIPSSIRDLSRNEKLSLIVLRWLPSG